MWGDNTKGQVTLHRTVASATTIRAVISTPQLGSGDKKPYSAPYCVTNAAGTLRVRVQRFQNHHPQRNTITQSVHSVVCGEMMTAAIDSLARAVLQR
jgi:hypothetical protein